jgi:hypothetical protein
VGDSHPLEGIFCYRATEFASLQAGGTACFERASIIDPTLHLLQILVGQFGHALALRRGRGFCACLGLSVFFIRVYLLPAKESLY